MNPRRRALADSLYAASREHDDAQADRLARWRNVEPETTQLLGVLVRANRCGRGERRRRRAGDGIVELRTEDAATARPTFPAAAFDFIFLDAEGPSRLHARRARAGRPRGDAC